VPDDDLKALSEEMREERSEAPPEPRWRPASEPTCCGAGCDDCPF
jgi:hypothetical protein